MHIHILGASGSGTSTLGKDLAEALGFHSLDADSFYWLPTDPPFTQKRAPLLRNEMLASAMKDHPQTVVSGSMISWGESWQKAFDAVIFRWIPPALRLERLHLREMERYGSIILNDPIRNQAYQEFITWASGYDRPDFESRSLAIHQKWLNALQVPVFRLDGDLTREACVAQVQRWLLTLPAYPTAR